ncbi:hypothetical protein BDY17DRAFT_299822 [Neohortaea acidophila]|uniref:F-box domain-containing protein n=1 Tax=Neohortaea acidophila TaxID=245834 RepID=A0A6A6PP47_9PEZI|nr:uncharacterized protein BDY17DRAFT_299822 [Neohortaea acidophila]KAF2481849.1 hypothetical protein BDY17DRAFT_299822 [Neohortaea acidophila]
MSSDTPRLSALPDELVEAITFYLPPDATLALGLTCTTLHKIAYEHLVWRRHCIQGWQYWEAHHEIADKLLQPPAQTKWRHLYNQRRFTDKKALDLFNELLLTQQKRIERIEEICRLGYDVKDLMLDLCQNTPDSAEDVLARRYYADVVLGRIHRATALEKWTRLQERRMVRLEEVLAAYDLFVLSGRKGDLHDIDQELDRIARAIRAAPDFEHLSTRNKAIEVARYMREQRLLGNPTEEDYHALRNNFISLALFEEPHTSLPLQSVAIYCAVARRLGINARPSNYPSHVHAVIEAPSNQTLDGREKPRATAATEHTDEDPDSMMHMDPWRSSEEVPREQLTLRLSQMGAPPAQHAAHLGPTNNYELALRTGRNIMNSVQDSRERQGRLGRSSSTRTSLPDVEAAWYGMLWAMMVLGDNNQAATLHRRRQCLPYLADHFQTHFPEDIGMLESTLLPMFINEREQEGLLSLVTISREADRNAKAPKRRAAPDGVEKSGPPRVQFKIGQHFEHKRYGYRAVVVGWDFQCAAEPRWIHQMRVDDLPRGREQPFYNVM